MEREAAQMMQNFHEIYQLLEDEESKDIYLARLDFLITGDTKYMNKIVKKYLSGMTLYKGIEGITTVAQKLPQSRSVVLYGAGYNGKRCLPYFRNHPGFFGFCDKDDRKQQAGFCGFPVMSPERLVGECIMHNALVVLSTARFADEIETMLLKAGVDCNSIIRVDEFLDYEMPDTYFTPSFLKFSEHEIFVDAGCYDLETTAFFAKHCKQLDKVFAFEPDPSNFQACLRNREKYNLPQAEIYEYGTWSSRDTLHFRSTEDTGASISADGETTVEVVAIDDVVRDAKVTCIKMDVEGAELESLKGARKTIEKNRPQLVICIYHKPEDMVTLPMYIKSLVPDYRFYVRHPANTSWGTVLYAV